MPAEDHPHLSEGEHGDDATHRFWAFIARRRGRPLDMAKVEELRAALDEWESEGRP